MARKYLDDINVSYKFNDENDVRIKQWEKEREIYGFDERETWDLAFSFYAWLYERLNMYKEYAGKIVNLDFHKIEYDGEIMTQLECIDKMIKYCEIYLTKPGYYLKDEDVEDVKKITELWNLIINTMWW